MSELIRREDVQREIQASFDGCALGWQDWQDLMDRINALPTASPWRRVDETPKKDGWYMLCFLSRWRDGNWWIPNFPDYWMDATPPKEDE